MRLQNVLVVAAHPDDEVLGVGGTIPLIKAAGGRVTTVIVTDGSSVQYPGDKEILARKLQHAREANDLLGVDELVLLDFPDQRLDTVDHYQLNAAFEELVSDNGFDAVFMPSLEDINLDHVLVHRSVMVACRPTPGQTVKALVSYHTLSSTEWGPRDESGSFRPNFYVDIEETLPLKLEAMGKYADELRDFPHPRSLEGISHRAAVFGTEAGYTAAEGFKLLLLRADSV